MLNLFILLTVWRITLVRNVIFECFLPQEYRLCINANTVSSGEFFNTCLNQKAKYILRLESDLGKRWLRVPKIIL